MSNPVSSSSQRPIRVAILGGGCAGVTAAFELSRPEHAGRYQVTVYQQGWRLGGKGASGRGPADRIEEHGLHLWMGFYENAFLVMRQCYEELGRDPSKCRIATWRDAFIADPLNGVADRAPDGTWLPWLASMPPFPGEPGDPDAPTRHFTVADYLARSLTLLRSLVEAVERRAVGGSASRDGRTSEEPQSYVEQVTRMLRLGRLTTLAGVIEGLRLLEMVVGARSAAVPDNLLLRFQSGVGEALRAQLASITAQDDEARRLWEIADLVLAMVRGAIRFRLASDPRGFDAIDDYDCREWLRLNGASESSINSAFIRALYDLAFAYENGDVRRPRIAAGQAVRGAVRAFFTYRGAFFWKMRSGMGDVVFAPFYEVLARRGVRFEFFHRLRQLRLSPEAPTERPHVRAIDLDVQARPHGGTYQPLIDVRGLPCWPSEPDWSQLEDGEALRAVGVGFESHWEERVVGSTTLQVGRDFDLAVLAVGGGAVQYVSRELAERSERWQAMLANLHTVPTQALQLWLKPPMRELGWNAPPVNLSGFVEPFDTWADMTHLTAEESWPRAPQSIAYFCSVLADGTEAERAQPTYPALRHAEVRGNAIRFLARDLPLLWPRAQDERGFRWDVLITPDVAPCAVGEQRIDTQYYAANVNPTDRYSLSLPGTLKHRLSPLDEIFDNFTIAGDWTRCGFNEGCVEAAVISGRLAAHALSGLPRLEDIPGYDHP